MKRKKILIINTAILFLALILGKAESSPRVVIVVNSQNPLTEITPQELRNIYYGKKLAWSDGTKIEPVDLSTERKERSEFNQMVFNLDPQAVEKAYMKLAFTGQGSPPQQTLPTPQKVLSFVSYNRSAIGYVDETDVSSDAALQEKIKIIPLKN